MTFPFPGLGPAAPPPPRHGRGWVVAVAVAGVAAVGVLCVLPALGFFGWWFLGPDLDEPEAAAGHYLERVVAGDDAGAYRLLCADVRQEVSPAEFTALMDAGPRPLGHAVTGSRFRNEPGSKAAVGARLDGPGASRQVDLYLEEAEGTWRVCGDTLI